MQKILKKISRNNYLKILTILIIIILLIASTQIKTLRKITAENAHFFYDSIKKIQNSIHYSVSKQDTKLKSYYISIKEKNYNKLTENLPQSGEEYVNINLSTSEHKNLDAKLKIRGDSNYHWAYEKKSYKIKYEANNKNQYINLINPKNKSQLIIALGLHLTSQAGILSPNYEFVTLYINDNYQGVYIQTEEINEEFIKNNKLLPGSIFYVESNAETIGKADPKGIILNPDLWEVKYESPLNKNLSNYTNQFSETLKINSKEKFQEEIKKVIDLEKYLQYVAIQNIAESDHIDSFHNLKLYLNPKTNLFEPIAWDVFSWLPLTPFGHMIKTNNILTNKLLQIPELRHQKNQYIYNYINSFASFDSINQYIEEESQKIKPDLYLDPIKDYCDYTLHNISPRPSRPITNKDWEEAIEFLKYWYKYREIYLRESLEKIDTEIFITPTQDYFILTIKTKGEADFNIINQDLQTISFYQDSNKNQNLDNNENQIEITNHTLYPGTHLIEIHNEYHNRTEEIIEANSSIEQFLIPKTHADFIEIFKKSKIKNNITNKETQIEIQILDNPSNIPKLEKEDFSNSGNYLSPIIKSE